MNTDRPRRGEVRRGDGRGGGHSSAFLDVSALKLAARLDALDVFPPPPFPFDPSRPCA